MGDMGTDSCRAPPYPGVLQTLPPSSCLCPRHQLCRSSGHLRDWSWGETGDPEHGNRQRQPVPQLEEMLRPLCGIRTTTSCGVRWFAVVRSDARDALAKKVADHEVAWTQPRMSVYSRTLFHLVYRLHPPELLLIPACSRGSKRNSPMHGKLSGQFTYTRAGHLRRRTPTSRTDVLRCWLVACCSASLKLQATCQPPELADRAAPT